MKKYVAIILVCMLLLTAVGTGLEPQIFKRLHSLEGMWVMKTAKGFVGEEWKKINNDYLQNRGFKVSGTDTVITETVALRNKKEGIFYISTVTEENSSKPVSFKLTAADNNLFVFENARHDYPKRISYQLVNKDSMVAWIDGGRMHPGKKSLFTYYRVKK